MTFPLTHAFAVVGLYAALNTVIMMMLGWSTGQLRRKHKVLIGDGGVPELTRIMRGHANAAENVPMTLVMLIVAAGIGAPAVALHAVALPFTIGRALHAWHFAREDAPLRARFYGFGLSAIATAVLALGLLGHGAWLLLRG